MTTMNGIFERIDTAFFFHSISCSLSVTDSSFGDIFPVKRREIKKRNTNDRPVPGSRNSIFILFLSAIFASRCEVDCCAWSIRDREKNDCVDEINLSNFNIRYKNPT